MKTLSSSFHEAFTAVSDAACMALVKRISALAALLVVPIGLAWAGQALGSGAGSPEVGDSSITMVVDPRSETEQPGTLPAQPSSPHEPAPAPEQPAPEVTAPAVVPEPSPPTWSDVQRQPLPVPQWDDGGGDWDDDDDWDDDWGDDDDWDDSDDWDDDSDDDDD